MDEWHADQPDPRPRRRPRSRFWLWTGLLTYCALLGLGKPILDMHRRNELVLWRESVRRERDVRSAVSGELQTRLLWARQDGARRAERILGLTHGYLGTVPARGRATVVVLGKDVGSSRERIDGAGGLASPMRASAAGWSIDLHFLDGRVVAGRASAPPVSASAPNEWPWNAANAAIRLTLFAAPLVWLGGLLGGLVERTRGTRFGEVALAGALAGTVAWAVRPGATPAGAGWVGLALGAAMALVAFRMICWLGRIERARRLHFCYDCGYDLTGNVSGVCPECGAATPDSELRRNADRAEALAQAVALAAATGDAGDDPADELRDEAGTPDDPPAQSEPSGVGGTFDEADDACEGATDVSPTAR